VRLRYPAALVELALLLCGTVGVPQVASGLGLGKSTVYRWTSAHRTAWMSRSSMDTSECSGRETDVIAELLSRCQRAGFHVRSSLLSHAGNSIAVESEALQANELSPQVTASRVSKIIEIVAKKTDAPTGLKCAKHEIENNFRTRLSCQRLADVSGLPRIKFIKLFAATFGVPPYHYLLAVRVQHALRLLEFSKAPFPIVAATTGFGSATSMQRAFKRFAGASPGKVMNTIAPSRNHAYANSQVAALAMHESKFKT